MGEEKVKGLLIQLSNCLQNLSSASRLKSGGVRKGVAKANGRGKPRNLPEAVFSPECFFSLSPNQRLLADEQRGLATPTYGAVCSISMGLHLSEWQSRERNRTALCFAENQTLVS